MRILQVVGRMNRAGAETWLMHVLRHLDRSRFKMDFLVHPDAPGYYDDEIMALGGRLVSWKKQRTPWQYLKSLRHILAHHGPYDIVHCHLQHFGGLVMYAAKVAGVPVRIAHSHTMQSRDGSRPTFLRSLYFTLTTKWIQKYATAGLACSTAAAESLFGKNWHKNPRWQVLYCGFDLRPFHDELAGDRRVVRQAIFRELGMPADSFVIGHVGRLVSVKNHRHVLTVAAHVVRQLPQIRVLCVGEGPLRSELETYAHAVGLQGKVVFAGPRSDIARLLMNATDVLLFPSHYEGLGMAVVEAQAAGVPCVISDGIPAEVSVVPGLVNQLSLSDSVEAWGREVTRASQVNAALTRDAALRLVEASPFNIRTSVNKLQQFYCEHAENPSRHNLRPQAA